MDGFPMSGGQLVKDVQWHTNTSSIEFMNADFVTGLHGAGYANIEFCSPNTKILELKPYSSGDVIKNLSKNSSLSYRDISIKPSINNLQNQSGQIIIPITELKDKINF